MRKLRPLNAKRKTDGGYLIGQENMTLPSNIYLERIKGNYLSRIQEGFSFIDLARKIRPGDTVFIKPNLTFPHYRKAVMTSPECVEKIICALKDYGVKIIVGESDSGGYNRFSMDKVFEKTGLRSIAANHGVELVNLSGLPARNIQFTYKHKSFMVPLPRLLLDEVQLFITAPVPKIHMHTKVSMSIKNQWGCIQEPGLRLKLHPYFKKVILEVNKAIGASVSVIDGRFGLNRSGPMEGDVEELDWLMVADNILSADRTGCRLMGIDPDKVPYLRFFGKNQEQQWTEAINCNQDLDQFSGKTFYLKRKWTDYPGHFAFRSPLLAYLAYHSPLSEVLHKFLYLFRDKFYEYG
jgi:uncharacterized protein (DUF362 family)